MLTGKQTGWNRMRFWCWNMLWWGVHSTKHYSKCQCKRHRIRISVNFAERKQHTSAISCV